MDVSQSAVQVTRRECADSCPQADLRSADGVYFVANFVANFVAFRMESVCPLALDVFTL